jgi:hypothetical protein
MGALAANARHDGLEITAKARKLYQDSFLNGHGCKICPRIDIPDDLPDQERQRRADSLRKLHFARMALRSSKARQKRA